MRNLILLGIGLVLASFAQAQVKKIEKAEKENTGFVLNDYCKALRPLDSSTSSNSSSSTKEAKSH